MKEKKQIKHDLAVGLLSLASAVGFFCLGSYLNNRAENFEKRYPVVFQIDNLRDKVFSLDEKIYDTQISKQKNDTGSLGGKQYEIARKTYEKELEKLYSEREIYSKKIHDLKNTAGENDPNFNKRFYNYDTIKASMYCSYFTSIASLIFTHPLILDLTCGRKRGKKHAG